MFRWKLKNNINKNKHSKKSSAPLGEIGAAQVQEKYSTYPSNGLTPYRLANILREADAGDIMRQMELFEEMEEKDAHLFSQLQTRKNAVAGLDYEIIPFSDDELDKEIAEFVKKELESLENIEEIFIDLLDAIGKGIAVCEIIWKNDLSGKTKIDDIKWRHQKRFFWDNNDLFKMMTREYPSGVELPQDKFIIHTYKARSGHASRAGVLRVITWMYLFKNYDIKDWVSFCEVFGMPLRLGKYSPSASEDDKRALMNALVQIGTDAAGIIPDTTEIDFKESSKSTSINVYESLARFCDEQISKAILGQTLTSDSGGGSYAQSKTHNEVRHDLTIADCKALATTLRRDLIKPLVKFNFSSDRLPYIRFDCEESVNLKETADVYKTLISDIGLEIPKAHLYKKFSIPKPQEGEEIIKPPVTKVQEDTTNIIANKGNQFNKIQKNDLSSNYQNDVDKLVDVTLSQSKGIFSKIINPVIDLINESKSLEDIKEYLEDDKFVENIYKKMDVEELEELLQKSMFYADLIGRIKENERID